MELYRFDAIEIKTVIRISYYEFTLLRYLQLSQQPFSHFIAKMPDPLMQGEPDAAYTFYANWRRWRTKRSAPYATPAAQLVSSLSNLRVQDHAEEQYADCRRNEHQRYLTDFITFDP